MTLARKVESEIFRAADAPKGAVSVNAENGVVFLRGEVDKYTWVDEGSETEDLDRMRALRRKGRRRWQRRT